MSEPGKRDFSRVPLALLVRYRNETDAVFREGQVRNISIGGLYIVSDDPYGVGTKVYLQFLMENGEIAAEGWARVVHELDGERTSFGRGMGLELVSADEKLMAFTQLVVSEELIQSRHGREP